MVCKSPSSSSAVVERAARAVQPVAVRFSQRQVADGRPEPLVLLELVVYLCGAKKHTFYGHPDDTKRVKGGFIWWHLKRTSHLLLKHLNLDLLATDCFSQLEVNKGINKRVNSNVVLVLVFAVHVARLR